MCGGIKPRKRSLISEVQLEKIVRETNSRRMCAQNKAAKKFVRACMRRVSKARAKLLREYSREVKAWKFGRTCAGLAQGICGKRPHLCDDAHHSRGRAGSLLMDKRFWIPVCRRAHAWIQDHPQEARALGLLCEPGEWNVPVKEGA